MADVRFLIICGPPTLDPSALGFPPSEPHDQADIAPVTPALHGIRHGSGSPVALKRRSGVFGELTDASVAGWWYAWRLMSSNNRLLARGASSSSSRLHMVEVITRLKSNIAELRPLVGIDQNNGKWRWRAEHGELSVAACPHWYERERDCRGGFTKFVDATPRAMVANSVLILRDTRGSATNTHKNKEARRWPT